MRTLTALRDTPVPLILIAAGLFLLAFSLGPLLRERIKIPSKRQNTSIGAGLLLLLLGISLYLLPALASALLRTDPPVIMGVTIREDHAGEELVYQQEINFYDEDGNTNIVERELIDLSDPSQQQYIKLENEVIDDLPAIQRIRSTATSTWHCEGHTYVATVQATLVDSDGNRSEPVRYRIECK